MENSTDDSDYTRKILLESAEKVFYGACSKDVIDNAEAGTWPEALWGSLEQLGFFTAAIPEEQGGAALELADLLATVRTAGRYAAPIPFGETILAGWLLACAGLEVPAGALAFGPVTRRSKFTMCRDRSGWLLDGTLRSIPWGKQVSRIALIVDTDSGPVVTSVDPRSARHDERANLAGESRVHMSFDQVLVKAVDVGPVSSKRPLQSAMVYGALLRSLQMAGALQLARDLSVRYAGERIAFGKPLNQLPAVQQNLAVLAGQAAAANVAADMMLDALASGSRDLAATVALGRLRINAAVEIGARLAHQVHGAIGFTYEHMLHHATRRLWSWRDEFGNDTYWSETIGQQLINAGPDRYWASITEVAQL